MRPVLALIGIKTPVELQATLWSSLVSNFGSYGIGSGIGEEESGG